MSLEELLLRDELRREAATPGEVGRLLERVDRRLEDAAITSIHPETRLEQAYHAILNCALAALRASDLRLTDRPGHHVVALESLYHSIGTSMERIDYFQTVRDLRNRELYTGTSHITVQQAEEAIEEARLLQAELKEWLKAQGLG